ncbi:hypothetical protein BT96DRAFT_981826 [Gymnopus androsaceus JB14]|uniref:Uncharacterized protein n=1 Tax=Gymnopus androsaceus JB14 TaxID=1447944 RepID=A0A6A4GLS3_9AGAR|nr:hypothetical protein BT96DRAFT_981826 [Gymnopus androsaceus JB14]
MYILDHFPEVTNTLNKEHIQSTIKDVVLIWIIIIALAYLTNISETSIGAYFIKPARHLTISCGGLGPPRLISEVVGIVLDKGYIQFMLCLVVFCIVFFVLAYLTNPSENSFRAYFTEHPFHQHPSRINDDSIDDDAAVSKKSSAKNLSFRTGSAGAHHTLPLDNRSPFHFANRVSVSLRTPKHVFHSFGIFTIAGIIPSAKTDALQDQPDASTISGSWFIGAFGKWWRGGVLEAWHQDIIVRSGDEESWNSGILGMKTSNRLNELNDLPGLPHGLSRRSPDSPPRIRSHKKSSQQTQQSKFASRLFLHASQSPPERTSPQHSHSSPVLVEQLTKPAPTKPTSFEQSPQVVELLNQISQSKSTVLDLRAQLNESQSAASQSHAALQTELESFRERKRQEDAAKNEVKSRTKTWEDSKRVAECTKHDAEKRLRASESARDDAAQRIEHLDQEIVRLQNHLANDNAFLAYCRVSKSDAEQALVAELEHKKREIKVVEDVVAALGLRARELEEKLAEKRERVHLMRAQAEAQKHQQALPPFTAIETWPFTSDLPVPTDPHSLQNTLGYTESLDTVSCDSASTREEMPLTPAVVDFLERDRREKNLHVRHQSLQRSEDNITSAPTTVSPTVDPFEHDPFRIFAPQHDHFGLSKDIPLKRNNSDPFVPGYPNADPKQAAVDRTHIGPWYPLSTKTKTKAKKVLNPDDVTRIEAKPVVSTDMVPSVSTPMYDALNPNAFGHTLVSSTTTDSNFVRAFTPSPAEREVWQRGLGGSSTNGSLERLYASMVDHSSPRYIEGAQRDPAAIPWWQSPPRNFDPWDDEESPRTAVEKRP